MERTTTIRVGIDLRDLAANVARAHLAARLFGHSMADTADSTRALRHQLQRLDRIRNVRLRVLMMQANVMRMGILQQAALERAHGRRGGILGQPWRPRPLLPHAWLRPGHWTYRAALGFVFATLVAVAGVLGWLLFTTPWSA